MTITGLVLAAGSSRRLGQPKQLLAYKGRTLLDATLDVARAAPFDQRLLTTGGAAEDVHAQVDVSGFDIVDALHHTQGCSSSIVSALASVDESADGIVLLLGDQPEMSVSVIEKVVGAATPVDGATSPLAVTRYDDGIGHPFWFGREVFGELSQLHGDKAVWKLIESGTYPVTEVIAEGPIPLDVDTWDDYETLLTATGQSLQNLCTTPPQGWSSAQILEEEGVEAS